MGANRFLKVGEFELDSRGARTFFKRPPSSYPSIPNFRGLGYELGGLNIAKPP